MHPKDLEILSVIPCPETENLHITAAWKDKRYNQSPLVITLPQEAFATFLVEEKYIADTPVVEREFRRERMATSR